MNFNRRITALRTALKKSHAHAVLISTPINVIYLTGFNSSNAFVLVSADDAVIITDFRYQAAAETAARIAGVSVHIVDRDPFPGIAAFCQKQRFPSVAFEEQHLSYSRARSLISLSKKIDWLPVPDWTERIRRIKEPEEIQAVKYSISVAERAYKTLRKSDLLGLAEYEAADLLEARVKQAAHEAGAQASMSFGTIIAAGPNASEPHHHVTDAVIKRAQLLKIDFGVNINHYCSDITRMFYFGTPTAQYRKIYAIVLKAQLNAIKAVNPGARMCDIDNAARSIIDNAGYGECFVHGTGHGLGMAGAELFGARPGDTTLAEPGMIITIEPGIYIPGWGGIRIEDDILVTETGAEILTSLPK